MTIGTRVPETFGDITPDWISGALNRRGENVIVTSVRCERIGIERGLSSDLCRASLEGRGCPSTVVVKLWATDAVDADREISFYRQFAERSSIRIPRSYHAASNPDSRRGVLVLEDVRGEAGDCLEILDVDRASNLARSLARFHVCWLDAPEIHSADWIPSTRTVWRGDEWFTSRQVLFLERFRDRLHVECRPLFDSIGAVETQANDILSKFTETLLHSDLHLDNLVFEDDGDVPVILDWAQVSRGPAVLDLADVVSAMVPPDGMEAVFTSYVMELQNLGLRSPGERELARGLTGALLRRFITSTCGVARWIPASPREERMIEDHIFRTQQSLLAWRERDPEGFPPFGRTGRRIFPA